MWNQYHNNCNWHFFVIRKIIYCTWDIISDVRSHQMGFFKCKSPLLNYNRMNATRTINQKLRQIIKITQRDFFFICFVWISSWENFFEWFFLFNVRWTWKLLCPFYFKRSNLKLTLKLDQFDFFKRLARKSENNFIIFFKVKWQAILHFTTHKKNKKTQKHKKLNFGFFNFNSQF